MKMDDMNIKLIYCQRLKKLRNNANLTQEFIAKILDIKQNAYSQYETEYVIIPIKHLNILCNYFNVSFDYLFNFSKNKNYNDIRMEINGVLVSERLKELRKENNLTQLQLANILHVSKSTISEYERKSNNKIIATPFLYTICKKYRISADYLLGKIDEPKYIK